MVTYLVLTVDCIVPENTQLTRSCRREKRVYVESEVGRGRGAVTALYQIIRRLSGRFESTCNPVKHESGVCCLGHWRRREYFERVFSHEELPMLLEVESGNELNVEKGRITRVEIKNAIKKTKSRQVAVCDNIQPKANEARRDISGGFFGSLQPDME